MVSKSIARPFPSHVCNLLLSYLNKYLIDYSSYDTYSLSRSKHNKRSEMMEATVRNSFKEFDSADCAAARVVTYQFSCTHYIVQANR